MNEKNKGKISKEVQAGKRNTARKTLLGEKKRENHRVKASKSQSS